MHYSQLVLGRRWLFPPNPRSDLIRIFTMCIYHIKSRLFRFVILMLVTDRLLVAVQMITFQVVSVNIKWKMARFACLCRNGTRTILRINIDNTLNVKQKINTQQQGALVTQ